MRNRVALQMAEHQAAGLWRQQAVRHSRQGTQVTYDADLLNFNSNDYLGFSADPEIAEALGRGAALYGSGAGSANTLSGYSTAHESLIQTIREWLNVDDVLLFSSGYLANIAVLTALFQKGDRVFMDRLAHASLIDGVRLSEATFRRYPHQRLDTLETWLKREGAQWIVSESLFGMDGDVTDLNTLCRLANENDSILYIDEAHALGVYGDHGEGLIGDLPIPLRLGTLSKAIGLQGAFVAGDKDLIEYCRQFARPYLFTTALSPAIAYAATVAIQKMKGALQARKALHDNVHYLRERLQKAGFHCGSDSLIQPILFKDIETTTRVVKGLREKGIYVSSLRYPTVPMDSPRVRISLNAHHTRADIDTLMSALSQVTQHANT